MSITAQATLGVPKASAEKQLSPENYKFLQQEIHRDSGIVLDADKHYLFEARLIPLLRVAKLSCLDELCARLRARSSPDLARQVMEALTTNETLFFRDMAPFVALRTQLLPGLLSQLLPSQPLRIWSAAASSGQEAYSIAMLLRDMQIEGRQAHVLGTDISEQILASAREAKYAQFEVNRGLPALHLAKYFNRIGLDWQVKDELRSMVTFRRFDLRQPMTGLGKFHVIFCRNVLIYFDAATKAKVLTHLSKVLEPGGYLLLGGAESIMNLNEMFERVPIATTAIYRRKQSAG